ncbi:MAG TPA: ABC transporter permease, partial [bacterium]|nr:ABC transporter permease [bacterium]
ASVFDLFSFDLIQGDPSTALTAPNTIVITTELAHKYFGTEDPVGRSVQIGADADEYKITGVMKAVPAKSHFKFDFLVSLNTLQFPLDNARVQWANTTSYTFALLTANVNIGTLENQIASAISEKQKAAFGSADPVSVVLQPVYKIHMYSKCEKEIEPSNDINNILIISSMALFILITAIFNFVNLTTAYFIRRTKEVGLRKTFGADKYQIVRQFLMESILITLIASVFSLVVMDVLLYFLNSTSNFHLNSSLWSSPLTIVGFLFFSLFVGIIAGLYPSFVLSRLQPAHIIKQNGATSKAFSINVLRKTLLVLQFVISAILIIGTGIIYNQLSFLQNKNLGLEKERVVILPISRISEQNYNTLKFLLGQSSKILGVSGSISIPGERVIYEGIIRQGTVEELGVRLIVADYDFTETYGMTLVEGRNFSNQMSSDSSGAFIINEKAKNLLEYKEVIGKTLEVSGLKQKGAVVGVVKDFNFTSLRSEIQPLVIFLNRSTMRYNYISIKFIPNSTTSAIQQIETVWMKVFPNIPFEYYFLDDAFESLYQSEINLRAIAGIFAILAMVIGALGLLGLVSLSVGQRTKEIGIRKVLGATVFEIVALISKDFLVYVILANLIAWPIIYFGMKRWLDNFAYRIEIDFMIFAEAMLLSLGITIVTVAFQALKAAITPPVETLKCE